MLLTMVINDSLIYLINCKNGTSFSSHTLALQASTAVSQQLSTMATLRHCSNAFQTCLLPSSSSPSKSFITSLSFKHSCHNYGLPRLQVSSSSHSASSTKTDNHTTAAAPDPVQTTETFDWYAQWYPLEPICDLDKGAPKARTVLGLDLVIWWDRVEGAWKVFDDRCPHRLAPLSEGRIDHRGRLQCVYHGWCFDGAGACKYIPQAPALGPPVHKNEKACVAVYPNIVQNNILWVWLNTSSLYQDIMHKTKPPYFPELDDPSFVHVMTTRDILYGYEILTENLLDPAHLPYAHYGILGLRKREDPGRVETDREGGTPMKLTIEKSDINGFDAGYYKFIAPCVIYFTVFKNFSDNTGKASRNAEKLMTILLCVPVSPGKSRVITIATWNFATLINKFIPRWYSHIGGNLVMDSDLYLLHVEERKLASEGILNWHKVCYVPTQSDAMVVAFRSWLRKYSNNMVDWRDKNLSPLSASPSREQLMDRYWSHVVHCKSCSGALRKLKAIKISLQVISVAVTAILAATNPSTIPYITKASIVAIAVMSFVASHWLSQFIHKTFYYHDYNHANLHSTSSTIMRNISGSFGNFVQSL